MKPKLASIEITYDCNARCQYCCSPIEKQVARPLSEESILRVVSEMVEYGIDAFEITGGEPFLKLNLLKKMRALTKGRYLCVLTNGILLGDPEVKKFLPEVEEVRVSLDELTDPPKYRHGTMPPKILELMKKARQNTPGLRLSVTTMLSQWNLEQLSHMYSVLYKLDIDMWMIGFVLRRGRLRNGFKFDYPRFGDAFEALGKLVEMYLAEEQKPFLLDIQHVFCSEEISEPQDDSLVQLDASKHPCSYSRHNKVYVDYQGAIIVCPDFETPLTYIQDHPSIEAAIEAAGSHPFWSTCMSMVSDCLDCRYFNLCGTGCRASAIHWLSDPIAVDPILCSIWPLREKIIVPLLPEARQSFYIKRIREQGRRPRNYSHVSEFLA